MSAITKPPPGMPPEASDSKSPSSSIVTKSAGVNVTPAACAVKIRTAPSIADVPSLLSWAPSGSVKE